MNICNFLFGYLRIIVEGTYVERFLNMCSYHNITLWGLKPSGHNYEMNISVSGFRKLKPIIKKTKSKVIIKKRFGFPFFLYKHRKRNVFVLSAMLCIFLLYASTFFIFGIQINGNLKCTEEMIVESLKLNNVYPGIRKEKVNCTKITQYLRGEYNNIIWVSAHINGTKLIINMKENNEEKIKEEKEKNIAENIVADCDGQIISMITKNGTPMAHIGDIVKKGDILVTGELEIKNDAGEVVKYDYVSPDAEISIRTEIKYEDFIEFEWISKEYTGHNQKKLQIEMKDKVINIGSLNTDYKKYTSNFRNFFEFANIKIGMMEREEYKEKKERYTKSECEKLLNSQYAKFCDELEKKGVQILQNSVKIYTESKRVLAKGTITICKKSGIKQKIEKKELQEGI